MMISNYSRFELLLGCCLAAVVSASAASYYVAPTGSDSADGSSGSPWQTIQHGLDTVAPGDTLYINAGDYYSTNFTKIDGTAGSPITVQGLPGAWLRCTNGVAGGATRGITLSNSWYVIRGLSFYSNYLQIWTTNATHNLAESNWLERTKAISLNEPDLPYTNGPSFNTVCRNVFTNLAYNVAAMGVTGHGNLIASNIWWTGNDNDAIDFFGTSNVFRGNLFVDMSPSAEHTGNHIDMFQTFGDTGQECHWALIENNTQTNSQGHFFIANSLGPVNTTNNFAVCDIMVRNNVILNSAGDSFLHAPRIQFINNTFYGCGGITGVPQIWVRDIAAYGFPSNCVVLNNIIAESTANAPLAVDTAYTNSTVRGYNFISQVGGVDPYKWWTPHPAWPGEIYGGYAGFVSTNGSYDLHLLTNSVCLASGTNASAYGFNITTDYQTRAETWSQGAYETLPRATTYGSGFPKSKPRAPSNLLIAVGSHP